MCSSIRGGLTARAATLGFKDTSPDERGGTSGIKAQDRKIKNAFVSCVAEAQRSSGGEMFDINN